MLELDKERAEGLADTLTNTTVLHGDALDREILNQENISAMDVVLAVEVLVVSVETVLKVLVRL